MSSQHCRTQIVMTDKIFRCHECNLPFARLQNGAIVIESRHHGEKHTNSISVWDLVLLVIKSVASIERSTPDVRKSGIQQARPQTGE